MRVRDNPRGLGAIPDMDERLAASKGRHAMRFSLVWSSRVGFPPRGMSDGWTSAGGAGSAGSIASAAGARGGDDSPEPAAAEGASRFIGLP
jgi:hypothetical protein